MTTSGPAAGGEGVTTNPLTIDNCGRSQTFDATPGRVVSLDQGSTEILLSLGLADRMVGTASWTDPVRENLAEANARVPRLSDNAPSYEAVLGTDLDFVTASNSGLNWTIVRAVSRADIAAFTAAQVDDDTYANAEPAISN